MAKSFSWTRNPLSQVDPRSSRACLPDMRDHQRVEEDLFTLGHAGVISNP
jgi:hypothetical protein